MDTRVLLLIILGLVAIAWVLGRVVLREDPGLPYQKRPSLLTEAELKFFHVLRQAVDGRFSIQAMVRMADLIRVAPETPQSRAWVNRILAKHIDFLLCDHNTLEVQLAVELDDKTHQRPDRVERDQFVDQALASAHLPLLRVPVEESYDADQLRSAIESALK